MIDFIIDNSHDTSTRFLTKIFAKVIPVNMPNPRSTFRPIAPKPRELSREFSQGPLQELSQESLRELPQEFPQLLQEPPRGHLQDFNSDIIAVATLISPQPFMPEIQEITPIANTLTS